MSSFTKNSALDFDLWWIWDFEFASHRFPGTRSGFHACVISSEHRARSVESESTWPASLHCTFWIVLINLWWFLWWFFPRASERRVLPIVGVCISSSHLHTFSSSHLLSHLLIFTSSHLHICSSSHLLIFTSSHLHTFSSSHHICSSSHTHTFSLSLALALIPSHLHILSLSLFSFLSPFSLLFPLSFLSLLSLSPFSLSRLLYLSLFRRRVVPAGTNETWTLSHEMRVDRQKQR